MGNKLFVIKYSGPVGFIKPINSARGYYMRSQENVTESTLVGIEYRLFSEHGYEPTGKLQKIVRHKLHNYGIVNQDEMAKRSYLFEDKNGNKGYRDKRKIIVRGLLVNPELYLAFDNEDDMAIAKRSIISLCRNEDILVPEELMLDVDEKDFDLIDGVEYIPDDNSEEFFGINRYNKSPMYGHLS